MNTGVQGGVCVLQVGGRNAAVCAYGAEGDLGLSEEGVKSPNHVCTQQRGGQAPTLSPYCSPSGPVLSFPPSS